MNFSLHLQNLPEYFSIGGDFVRHHFFNSYKPTILVWSLTNRCNLNCSYCGLPGLKNKELQGEELFNYLDEAINNGLKILSLTGGEPLLHRNFHEFVNIARSKGVLVSLNSNGILVEKNIQFIKKNCFQVFISLDGPPELNDQYRGKGTSHMALEAIKILKKNKVKTNVTAVITKKTYNKIEEIVKFAEFENIPISFQPVFDKLLTQEENPDSLTTSELLESLDTMLLLKKNKNKFILNSTRSIEFLKDLIQNERAISCKTGKLFARIEPTGDMVRCGRVKEGVTYSKIIKDGFHKSFLELQNFKDCSICTTHLGLKMNIPQTLKI